MEKKIPTYKAIPMDGGMVSLALVDEPAVEVGFEVFNKEDEPLKFSMVNEERRLINGPLIRTDHKILRVGADGEPYYLVFDKETAQSLLEGFLRNGYQNQVNLSHSNYFPKGIVPVEFYIKDNQRGISPIGFESVADGSVFATYRVESDELWTAVKDGTFKGFSMEVYLDKEPVSQDTFSKLDVVDLIISLYGKE